MKQAVIVVGWIEALAFAGLGVVTTLDWLRHRGRQRAFLAWAIGLLALVTLAGRVTSANGQQPRLLSIFTVPLFLGSGYALILVRHSFIPVRRRTLEVLLGVVIAVSALLDALPPPSDPQRPPPLYLVAVLAFVLLWCGFIMEPVIRFWMASRRRPAVQRARLRALSLGYGGIVAVLLVAVGVALGAGPSSSQNQVYLLVLGLIVLGIIPLLYVSFAPPGWVRRLWRDREESAFRVATSDLLLEEDPALLAELALSWALRLTGADAGLVAGSDGEALASANLDAEDMRRLLDLSAGDRPRLVDIGAHPHAPKLAMLAPMRAPGVAGMVAVIAGAFTPVFGADELARLGEYGVSVGAALDRVRLVKALARQTERHESLLAAVSDLGDGLVVTHGSDVAYVNDAYCAITGFTADEVINAGIAPTIVSVERPRSIESEPNAPAGEPDHFETSVLAKDGHPVDVEISRRRQGTGAATQTTAIVRDISVLRRAEARFRGLLEAAPDGFVGIDPGGRVVLINEAAEQLLGAPRDKLLGVQVDTLLRSADGPGGLRHAAAEASADGAQLRLERTIVRSDGTEVPVEVTVSTAEKRGDDHVVLAALRDVSERIRAARELSHRAVELERSNAALQEFAYVASHDLQEPLRMVASYLQLLQTRYQGNLDSDADDFIGFAVDGARRMQALINDLLSYSRVGTQEASMEEVALGSIVETVVANLRASVEDTGARVVVGDLPTIVADPSQFVQLLQNLVGNAIKFHGGRAPEVRIEASRGVDEWVITVADNGIGIEPRHADRIFMIFKRLHPASQFPGTGIGLSICRKIVERRGGRIWIDSVPGSGSSFHFTVPDRDLDRHVLGDERRESPLPQSRQSPNGERIAS